MFARGLDDLGLEELPVLADEELDDEPTADFAIARFVGEAPVRIDALPHLLHVVAIVRIGRVEGHGLSHHAPLASLVVAAAAFTPLDRRAEGRRRWGHRGDGRLAARRWSPRRRLGLARRWHPARRRAATAPGRGDPHTRAPLEPAEAEPWPESAAPAPRAAPALEVPPA